MQGIYETLRTYNGVAALLPEHQARFERSCGVLGVHVHKLHTLVKPYLPSSFEGLEQDYRFRVAVFAGGAVEVTVQELPWWDGSFIYPEVWRLKIVCGQREQAGVKHSDTSFQKEARAAALEEGYGEILLVNAEGMVREGGITNVFFVEEDFPGHFRLVTPATGILPGIARALVISVATELGIEVLEREVHESELGRFAACFLTNSIRGIVRTVEGAHPLVQQVAEGCGEFLLGRLANRSS